MRHCDVDLDACLDGDPGAWGAFVDRTSDVIYAAVRRTMHRDGAAAGIDDAVQDVFVRLVRDDCRLLRSYDPSRAAISTWLTLIARSVAIDHLRRQRVRAFPLDAADSAGARETPRSDLSAPEPPMHVLSERQGLVLRMLFDEDLSVAEIAARLGVDEQTVRSTKHKALTRLREHMAGEFPAAPGDARSADLVQPEGREHP